MGKKIGGLSAHVRKTHAPALRERAPKVVPLEGWRLASLEARPPPASHFGCVDWYMYEHSEHAKESTETDGG